MIWYGYGGLIWSYYDMVDYDMVDYNMVDYDMVSI